MFRSGCLQWAIFPLVHPFSGKGEQEGADHATSNQGRHLHVIGSEKNVRQEKALLSIGPSAVLLGTYLGRSVLVVSLSQFIKLCR